MAVGPLVVGSRKVRRGLPSLALLLFAAFGGAYRSLAPHGVDPPENPPEDTQLLSQVPCKAGFADVFPCSNVDLLACVPLEESDSTPRPLP